MALEYMNNYFIIFNHITLHFNIKYFNYLNVHYPKCVHISECCLCIIETVLFSLFIFFICINFYIFHFHLYFYLKF